MDLKSMCTNSGILTVIMILKNVFTIVCTIIPIIVMIRTIMILFPAVISGDKINEKISSISKSVIAGIVVFLLPTIISYVFTTLVSFNESDVSACFTNATVEKIKKFKEIEEQEKEAEKQQQLKDAIEAARKKKEEEEKKNSKLEENNKREENQGLPGYGSIFVGDSRTVGYSYQLSLRDTDKIYATGGGAMAEFQVDVNKAIEVINANPNHRYNLVLNYGVNNVGQDWVSAYKNVINRVGGKADILIVSVNPCNDAIALYCRNANIVPLNNKLKNAFSSGYDNVKYCDTYTPFVNTPNYTSMIETAEGIHYTTEGANFIYKKINECLGSF